MTRPAGQVSGCFPILGSNRIASEHVQNLTGRARSGQEVFKYHTGRVVGSAHPNPARPTILIRPMKSPEKLNSGYPTIRHVVTRLKCMWLSSDFQLQASSTETSSVKQCSYVISVAVLRVGDA